MFWIANSEAAWPDASAERRDAAFQRRDALFQHVLTSGS